MAGPMASRWPTSSGATCARRPRASISAATSFSRASSRAASATSAPASASARATARPMPRLAPVTKARRLSRRKRSRTGIGACWAAGRFSVAGKAGSGALGQFRLREPADVVGLRHRGLRARRGGGQGAGRLTPAQRGFDRTPGRQRRVNPPQKASPAPVVSTTVVGKAGWTCVCPSMWGDETLTAKGYDAAAVGVFGQCCGEGGGGRGDPHPALSRGRGEEAVAADRMSSSCAASISLTTAMSTRPRSMAMSWSTGDTLSTRSPGGAS